MRRMLVQVVSGVVLSVVLAASGGAQDATARVPAAEGGPSMLLNAAPDSGYVYLSWSQVPNAAEYRVDWRPVSTERWHSQSFDAPAYHGSIENLENDVAYEFQVWARGEQGEFAYSSAVIRASPRVRDECAANRDFTCSIRDLRSLESSSPVGMSYHCAGEALGTVTPDTPNCAFLSGVRLYGFDRFFGSVFQAPPAVDRSLVRAAGRRAVWGDDDPFNAPERFAPPVLQLGQPDVGLVTRFSSASSYIIRLTNEVSSRFTVYAPPHAIPGQYMVYVEGHGLTANSSAADFLSWFLDRGWTVISMDMPLEGANAADRRFPVDEHDTFRYYAPVRDRPLDVFLLPVKLAIDHVLADYEGSAPNVVLAGRSGGGWTACIYGALDERVTVLIDVSGCWPRAVSLDTAVLPKPNVLHFETLQPRIFDQVGMTNFIAAAGTKGNFHFYSRNDPSLRFEANHPYVQYLAAIGSEEDKRGTTPRRTRVHIGQQTGHGLDPEAFDVMESFLRDIGLPMDRSDSLLWAPSDSALP